MRRGARIALVAAAGLSSFTGGLAAEKVFRAGASAVDISPRKLPVRVSGGFLEARADKVVDPLRARCLVLDDGTTRLAIAVVDSLMMPRDLIDEAKDLAAMLTGIPKDRMLISATHTHSAPAAMGALGTDVEEEYARSLKGLIAGGIERAARNLVPARVGWESARDSEHTHCRRWIRRPDSLGNDPFGKPTVRAMMHPGYLNPDYLGPAGPADDQVSVLTVQALDGRPIALLANYSMHYAGSPPVSADYFGVFAEKVREMIGAEKSDPPFVGILSQGTAGDQHWMDYGRTEKPGMDRFTIAEGVARAAAEAYRRIRYSDWVPLEMVEEKLSLGVRSPDEGRLGWAKGIAAGMAGRAPRTIEEVYAREQVLLAESPRRELILQALRIGDLGIAAIPAEVFGITGLEIKARSPLATTFTVELANGAEGYIPPPAQHGLGGYTTWPARSACLEVGAEPRIVEGVLELFEKVSGKPRKAPADPGGAYSKAVLAARPIAYFRMGEFRGPEAIDSSGNKNRGLYEGGIAYYLEGPAAAGMSEGKEVNRSPHFAGGRLRASLKGIKGAFSVELWFWNALPVDARPVTGLLLGMIGGPGDTLGLGGRERAQGKLFFSGEGAGPVVLEGTSAIDQKSWNHVVLSREGTKVAVYLNGRREPEISGLVPAIFRGIAQDLSIGGASDTGSSFEGKIDEVAIYDRALAPEEAAGHFQAAKESPR